MGSIRRSLNDIDQRLREIDVELAQLARFASRCWIESAELVAERDGLLETRHELGQPPMIAR